MSVNKVYCGSVIFHVSNHAFSKMVFFTTTCKIREIELRFNADRNGYIVLFSKDKTLKVGCKVTEIDDIKITSKSEADLSEIVQLVKNQVEVVYTTPELDPINPTRDHEIFPVCLRFFTLIKRDRSFGFSVTTKSRENSNKYTHTIGRVIENGAADIAQRLAKKQRINWFLIHDSKQLMKKVFLDSLIRTSESGNTFFISCFES